MLTQQVHYNNTTKSNTTNSGHGPKETCPLFVGTTDPTEFLKRLSLIENRHKDGYRRPTGKVHPTGWVGGTFFQKRADPLPYGQSGGNTKSNLEAQALVLSPQESCHSTNSQPKKRKRVGEDGLRSDAKRTIKNLAWLLQHKYGKDKLGFWTITLPHLTKDQNERLCLKFRQFWRILQQRITRHFERLGFTYDHVGVTEIHPSHWEKYKQVKLHLHLICLAKRSRKSKDFILTSYGRFDAKHNLIEKGLAHYVAEAVATVLSDPRLSTRYVRIDMQIVTKSAAAYIAKYMGKASHQSKLLEEVKARHGVKYLPKVWWTKNRQLLRELDEHIISGATRTLQRCEDWIADRDDRYLKSCGWVFGNNREGVQQVIGFWAVLTPLGQKVVKEIWAEEQMELRELYDEECSQDPFRDYSPVRDEVANHREVNADITDAYLDLLWSTFQL